MQRTQFCIESAKNDLKPMDFLKHNLYFETEGVCRFFDNLEKNYMNALANPNEEHERNESEYLMNFWGGVHKFS